MELTDTNHLKCQPFFSFFRKHLDAAVAAAVLIAISLTGTIQKPFKLNMQSGCFFCSAVRKA